MSPSPPRSPQLLAGPRAVHAQQLRLATLVALAQDEAAARRRRARRIWGVSVFAALSAVGVVFQSCGGSRSSGSAVSKDERALLASGQKSPARNARTGDDSEPLPTKSMFDAAATDLQALLEAGLGPETGPTAASGDRSASRPPTAQPVKAASPWDQPAAPSLPSEQPGSAEPAASPPSDPPATDAPPTAGAGLAMTVEPAPVELTTPDRRTQLTAELAALLKPAAAQGVEGLDALASLIALEAVQPGIASPEIEAALRPLSPDEAAAASAARDVVRALASNPDLLGDPAGLRAELTRHLDRLAEATDTAASTLTLNTLALCTRVESFGRYTPYSGNRFLAGRTNPAIVYVEVDQFTQLPASDLPGAGTASPQTSDDLLAVELTMRAELFHDDGSRQWRSAEAVIRDTSRTRRRDFFLVQRIDLPANLSVGQYNLKVTVRDRLAPETAAEAELTVPIQIVADAGLLGGSDPARTGAAGPTRPTRPISSAPTAGPEPLKPSHPTPLAAAPRR